MPKPATPPGKAKKDEKATKNVASFAKGKSVVVNVNVPADELTQYGQPELEALAANINALADALTAPKEDEVEEPETPTPAA